jgi:TolB protein
MVGGAARKLRNDISANIMLSSDGEHLAFARRNPEGKTDFILANTDGVQERVLFSHSPQFPAWSPDGNIIAFSSGNAEGGGEKMGIREIRLSDGAQREITLRKWQHVGEKSWLPDGSGLIVSARDQKTGVKQLWFVAYPSGEERPLSNRLDNFTHPRMSADARMLAAEQFNEVSEIWSSSLTDVAAGKKIGTWGGNGLCFMPDGRIIYSGVLSESSNEIWIMNADGSERKQLTFDSYDDLSLAASPDGRYIVFASNRTGNLDIWRMDLEGSNLLQLTHTKGANPPSVSPDGKWVTYSTSGELNKVPIEGGEPVRVCGNAAGVSAVSPDGKLIAFFTWGKDALGIAVNSFEDGSPIRKFEIGSQSLNNTSLKWTPDGKALLYSLSSDGAANIWMQPLDGAAPKQVTDFKSDGIFRFDVSADGRNLICARGGWKHDIVLLKNFK